jgi:hypothetical protein
VTKKKIYREGRIFNCVPSIEIERNWDIDNAFAAGLLVKNKPPRESVDYRPDWWKIEDQGKTGACVGIAVAEGLRWYFVDAGLINSKERLSARYLWMAAKETDESTEQPTTFIELEGTRIKAALRIARKYGVVKEEVLPFNSGKLYKDGYAKTFYAEASKLKISSYFNLKKDKAAVSSTTGVAEFIHNLRIWLDQKGPVMVRVICDDTWAEATQTKGNLDAYKHLTALDDDDGHSAIIVGYYPDEKEKGKVRFIFRNSWGKDWGDNGYAYATEDYTAWLIRDEAYGVFISKPMQTGH